MSFTVLHQHSTIVIAGSWNPSILSANWVAREVFKMQNDLNFEVGMEFPINGLGQPPKVEFNDIVYVASQNLLIFSADETIEHRIEKTIAASIKILELLPHTPVTGLGFNFVVKITDVPPALADSFSAATTIPSILDKPDAENVRQQWGATIQTSDHLLNMSAIHEGGSVTLSFNIHMEVTSAEQAATILKKEGLYNTIREDVLRISADLATEHHD